MSVGLPPTGLQHTLLAKNLPFKNPSQGGTALGANSIQMRKSVLSREFVSSVLAHLTKTVQPQEQYTRGLACTGTIRGLVGTAAISCTSLLRVASLNCSRCLIAMTKDPGPPMTQSS